MRSRTRMTAAAAAVTAALAAGTGAAVASTTGATPGAPARTMSATGKPGGGKVAGSRSAEERQAHAAMTAAVARALHVSADIRIGVGLRLRPGIERAVGLYQLFAAEDGRAAADPDRPRNRLRGLGLAIVRRIADMHGGTVEAIPLRRGVKFRISVPEIAVDPPPAERPPVHS